jgi:hypothetical protein
MTRLNKLAAIILAGIITACGPVGPSQNTNPPPTTAAPSLTPVPGGLGLTELKYKLLAQFPDFFFCDPDYYPVARADELDLARQRFPDLQANTEEFKVILAHNNLSGLTAFSDDQLLLIYREHKKLAAIPFEQTATGYHFQVQVAANQGQGDLVAGTIDGGGTIQVEQKTASFATCPICLAANTLIDTPSGPLKVTEVRVGTVVWTVDASGQRVAAPVIKVGKTFVPVTHQVIHIQLSDGRELWASPGHRTADGRTLNDVQVGGILDGATVTLADREAYGQLATYDLLPAGATGNYWANGVLIGSTLFDR